MLSLSSLKIVLVTLWFNFCSGGSSRYVGKFSGRSIIIMIIGMSTRFKKKRSSNYNSNILFGFYTFEFPKQNNMKSTQSALILISTAILCNNLLASRNKHNHRDGQSLVLSTVTVDRLSLLVWY